MENVWFQEGLPFRCIECGKCCTGSPGYVWLAKKDLDNISKYLKISKEEFLKKYVRTVGSDLSLLEKANSYDCIFLKDKKCTIYPVRPAQCRTYPFWPELLESKENFEEEAKRCPGIDLSKEPNIFIDEIEEKLLLYFSEIALDD